MNRNKKSSTTTTTDQATNNLIRNCLFYTSKTIGLGFEEADDNSWLIDRVEESTQAFAHKIKIGSILLSVNGRPTPVGADGLAGCFQMCMKKKTMMLSFQDPAPSLFRKRKPSLNLYQYDVVGGKQGTTVEVGKPKEDGEGEGDK